MEFPQKKDVFCLSFSALHLSPGEGIFSHPRPWTLFPSLLPCDTPSDASPQVQNPHNSDTSQDYCSDDGVSTPLNHFLSGAAFSPTCVSNHPHVITLLNQPSAVFHLTHSRISFPQTWVTPWQKGKSAGSRVIRKREEVDFRKNLVDFERCSAILCIIFLYLSDYL